MQNFFLNADTINVSSFHFLQCISNVKLVTAVWSCEMRHTFAVVCGSSSSFATLFSVLDQLGINSVRFSTWK